MHTAELNTEYRKVLCWLRGGHTTSDPDMENLFIDVMASLVKDRIEQDEHKRMDEAERHKAGRRAVSPCPQLSLRESPVPYQLS